jgi:RNA polymerase-binding transcription factor DksA
MNTQNEQLAKLEMLRTNIVNELETIATKNADSGDWEVKLDTTEQPETDENSEADAAEELESRVAIVAELETSYRNIERALQKLPLGTYGLCEVCGAPISPSRLDFLPSARTCTLHLDEEKTLPL